MQRCLVAVFAIAAQAQSAGRFQRLPLLVLFD